jgi:hypothetical protein
MNLIGTVVDNAGSIVIADCPMTVQGEYFVLDMEDDIASFIWDGQKQQYLIKTNSKQVGNFTAICTNHIPSPPGRAGNARCFFVRSEFLPQK